MTRREQLELEELPQRLDREDRREQTAEERDHREHVALDRDVIAAGAALEQEDEREAQDDQRRRRGGPAVVQRPAEDSVDQAERQQRTDSDPDSGGHGEGRQRTKQPAPVERPLAGGQGEHQGGNPDGQQRGDRQLARQERKGEAEQGGGDDQESRVDGLGQVQAPQAVDVARDPAALGHGAGQHRELVPQQDDVGDPLGDLTPRPHGHGEAGLFQGRDIVDAVADHGGESSSVRQRSDEGLLLLGGDPAEDRVGLRRLRKRLRLGGELGALHDAGGPIDAERIGDRCHRLAGVARDQLQVDLLLAHELDRLGGVRPQRLFEHDERPRLEPRGRPRGRVGGEAAGSFTEGDHAAPRPASPSRRS